MKSELINMTWAWNKEKIWVPTLFIYHTHGDIDSAHPSGMQDACHTWTQLKLPCSPWVPLAQWIERPPAVRVVMSSIPVRNSDFFFVPRGCHVDQFTFQISLPSLKFTVLFIYHTRNYFDGADPIIMQDASHTWTQLKWPCSPWVLVAQWIERPPSVREVLGSIPVLNSDFFFVPRSFHVDQFTFHISKIQLDWHIN